ncbi:MAG TPA: hypothetical protein VM537_16255 [Anaerolineae bacterium]|nr:hypothetical protein [Anaerolineae bacterium]
MSLYPRVITEYLAALAIPRGPESRIFLVDPEEGVDTALGDRWTKPLKTLIKAEDKCVAERHDTVLFLARATADNPTAAILWDKDYTHLVGLGPSLYGVGQRSRVVMATATALTPVITFSGNGCIVKNMQFGNEKASGSAAGVAIMTGQRCYFENVFFMCPFPTDAASYSLKLSGGENVFLRCSIGQTTAVRTGASYGLWMHKGAGDNQRNKFVKCEFKSWGGGAATHVLVYVQSDIDNEGWSQQFEDCLFHNLLGVALAQAIDDNCAVPHQILLRGHNSFAGVTTIADDKVDILAADYATAYKGGLMSTVID